MKKVIYSSIALVIFLFSVSLNASAANQTSLVGTPIKIVGASDSEKRNIEIHLGIEQGAIPLSALGFPRSNEYILRTSKQALQALGYYKPDILLSGDHSLWQLSIKAGNPVLFNKLEIQIVGAGSKDEIFNKAIKELPFHLNEQLNHGVYDSFKTHMLSLATENGYFDASFINKVLAIDIEASTAAITLTFDTKKRYSVNSISLIGTELSEDYLLRYIYVKEGDLYTQQAIIQTQQALNRSGYFSAINLEQQFQDDKKQVDLSIQLTDIEKYEFKTTLGFRTDSGATLGVGWHNRRVNDNGHQYLLSAEMSNIEKSTSFQYKLPIEGKKNELLYRYSYQIKNDELAETKLSSIETRMLLFHNDHWSSQTAVTVANEEIISDAEINSHLNYIIPSWRINYISAKDPFSAQSGLRWQNEIRVSSDALSDPDINFFQVEQKIKSVWALSDKWRILLRVQAGYTQMDTEQFNFSMPSNYRFFAGGDISVRGYEYQTLSPQDGNRIFLGGKHILTSNIEMDWRFSDNFRWAIFADQGSAFNDFSDRNQRSAVGTGIRWVTPLGSIRFDVARALDYPNEWRYHITIGPDL
jgi:translocation and assembly module TamA